MLISGFLLSIRVEELWRAWRQLRRGSFPLDHLHEPFEDKYNFAPRELLFLDQHRAFLISNIELVLSLSHLSTLLNFQIKFWLFPSFGLSSFHTMIINVN